MFERFTDRARKVMALANQEAQRFNHDHIDTPHILLGLLKEGGGVGFNVLRNLDVDPRRVRLELEKRLKPGPEITTTGKLPQTPLAKRVIEYAIVEAKALSHNYVGTEHLLLGMLRTTDGVAAEVLTTHGVKLDETREEVVNLLGAGIQEPVEQPQRPTNHQLRERKFRDHPLVRRYAAIVAAYDRDKGAAVNIADYELAARKRDAAERWKLRLRRLCQRLEKTPEFARGLPDCVLEYCSEVPVDLSECPQREAFDSALDAVREGRCVLVVSPSSSDAGRFIARVAAAAFDRAGESDPPPPRFFTPNHDLMLRAEVEGGYLEVLDRIAKTVIAADGCHLALRDLHACADANAFSSAVIKRWGQALRDFAEAAKSVIATSTPNGAKAIRKAWRDVYREQTIVELEGGKSDDSA